MTHERRRKGKAHQSEARQAVRPRCGQGPRAQVHPRRRPVLHPVRGEPEIVPLESLSRRVKSLPASERLTIRKADKAHALLGYQLAGTRVEQSVESLPLDEWPCPAPFAQPSIAVDDAFKQAFRQALEC